MSVHLSLLQSEFPRLDQLPGKCMNAIEKCELVLTSSPVVELVWGCSASAGSLK